jgi:hypothetical protein
VIPRHRRQPTMLLLYDRRDRRRLVLRAVGPGDRLMARLLAVSLDRRLAAGRPAESSTLLAARAQTLVAPDERRALASNWEHLLEVTRTQPGRRLRRVPVCRDRIAVAEPMIRQMILALVAPHPVPASGVAAVSRLLGDGTGPLYNRRSPTDLLSALREATRRLDPVAWPVASN